MKLFGHVSKRDKHPKRARRRHELWVGHWIPFFGRFMATITLHDGSVMPRCVMKGSKLVAFKIKMIGLFIAESSESVRWW